MNPYESRPSLIEEIKSVVKKEIEERFKKEREGKVNKYSTIMQNANISSLDIYSSIPSFTNQNFFNNKNAYTNMKNKINYGFSTDGKSYVNKASQRIGK